MPAEQPSDYQAVTAGLPLGGIPEITTGVAGEPFEPQPETQIPSDNPMPPPRSEPAIGEMRHVFTLDVEPVDGEDGKVRAVLSAESDDRLGDTIRQAGWELGNFRRHPVLLAGHDYRNIRAQIGEWESITLKGSQRAGDKRLEGIGRYYIGLGNELADWAWEIVKQHRAAFSVGFMPLEWRRRERPEDEEGDDDTYTHPLWSTYEFLKQELLEVSHVNVPAHPAALQNMLRQSFDGRSAAAIRELLELEPAHRGAIPYKQTPKDPEGASWNGPKEVAAAEVSDLRVMCTWLDPEQSDVKAGYKLPHHRAGGAHNVVWRGVAAAMSRLMQGATQIPDGDRKAVYNHLAKHYANFDKEPPAFKAANGKGTDELVAAVRGALRVRALVRALRERL